MFPLKSYLSTMPYYQQIKIEELNFRQTQVFKDKQMAYERNLLVSSLKLTKLGSVQEDIISKDAQIPRQIAEKALKKFCGEELIQRRNGVVEASFNQRIKIAIQAIKLGADFEKVCSFLDWSEFENIATVAVEANNFVVKRGFRFAWSGRRWEIDVLGFKESVVVCVDCKHWHHGWRRAAIVKAAGEQVKRTAALANALPILHEKIGLANWKETVLVPIVLSLYLGPLKFYEKTPIVPILQVQNFLNEFLANINQLTHFFPSID
jgi:hypothetical protein